MYVCSYNLNPKIVEELAFFNVFYSSNLCFLRLSNFVESWFLFPKYVSSFLKLVFCFCYSVVSDCVECVNSAMLDKTYKIGLIALKYKIFTTFFVFNML